MLFNSVAFIFWFLPIIFIGFFAISRYSQKMACGWLVFGAFFFYGYWNPNYIALLIVSILMNYSFGYVLAKFNSKHYLRLSKLIFAIGILANLGLLGYYKYSSFFVTQVNFLMGTQFTFEQIILPLGISFFTFTQIAFLVDVYKDKAKEFDLLRYFLFVTYFPHLIAGPIIHHAEMMPQFLSANTYRFSRTNFTVGSLIFLVGLIKKVLIADQFAPYANHVFNASLEHPVSFMEGWVGAVAYTFQLYFDFSGYSDMAIGLSKMLNIKLPINFNSPYKAQNIIDFWRQWHITLSRFLRDYLYIPLGGNRGGKGKRYRNLIATMVLGGLWHGASWSFILWGTLHGIYLTINHAWRKLISYLGFSQLENRKLYRFFAWALTFFAVVVAWVFFRAETLHSAQNVFYGMFGLNGFSISAADYEKLRTINSTALIVQLAEVIGSSRTYTQWIPLINSAMYIRNIFQVKEIIPYLPDLYLICFFSLGAIICFILPNTQQIFARYQPALETYPGDITPKAWLNNINWSVPIQIRFYGYIWVSYAISIAFMILFYSKNLDAKIFQQFPKYGRTTDVDMVMGDYRSNLFQNDIFLGNERKVIIVGSSYTELMSRYTFSINGVAYKSGSIGNAGNSLSNGFRAALVAINNFPVDTIVFGVSPLGFGKIITDVASAPTLNEQCTGSFNQLGFKQSLTPFKECFPVKLGVKDMAEIAMVPGGEKFFQFHGFLNALTKLVLYTGNPYIENSYQFKESELENLNTWFHHMKQQATAKRIDPPITKNGSNVDFKWLDRQVLESLDENGEVYIAFKALKKQAEKKGVKLVVYNSPTVSSADAPHIYPKGFLEAYRKKLAIVMNKLDIAYFDFGDEFIWDYRYTNDFIHLGSQGRQRIHAKLIKNIFFKEEGKIA